VAGAQRVRGGDQTGKVVLFDPFLMGNPSCPADRKEPKKADIIAVSHAHGDHASEVPAIAERTGATVVCGFETHVNLESKGVKNTRPMGAGGTQLVHGIGFTMTTAVHSSSFDEPGRANGGIAAGFVVTLEDGTRLYYAGDRTDDGDRASCMSPRLRSSHRRPLTMARAKRQPRKLG
jgi:L-ascorbate metabolism protein UlaG (beta-lactamase superfamily)